MICLQVCENKTTSICYMYLSQVLQNVTFWYMFVLQDTRNWPLIDPLPSYGRGRELPGARYMSFIHGDGLRDVFITGEFGPSYLYTC